MCAYHGVDSIGSDTLYARHHFFEKNVELCILAVMSTLHVAEFKLLWEPRALLSLAVRFV